MVQLPRFAGRCSLARLLLITAWFSLSEPLKGGRRSVGARGPSCKELWGLASPVNTRVCVTSGEDVSSVRLPVPAVADLWEGVHLDCVAYVFHEGDMR